MADDIYKNLREFRSPRDYVWQECAVKDGHIYQVINVNGTGNRWIEADWERVNITELDTTDIDRSFAILTAQVALNTTEIETLNRLLAKLLFELIEQGIEIQDQELINEVELYLKN